ncbi:MAG: Periplasmic serine endoprotease DegP [Labilithrix sp.]|nr:Periplasmic serine endoprotease DegP [Labilithrix sp.]
MSRVGLSRGILLLSFVGCGASPGPAREPAAPPTRPAVRATGSVRCPSVVDARDLLARHARAYGSPDAVAASLPLTIAGSISLDGRAGKAEIVVAPDATRLQIAIAGLLSADGVDAHGPWTLDGASSGIVERPSAAEAVGPAFDAWLLRRSYTHAFALGRDSAKCHDVEGPNGGARVDVTFALPELGSPVLAFDLETGALLSASHHAADGAIVLVTYEAWFDADHGVRWPRRTTTHPQSGNVSTQEYVAIAHGLECNRFDATGVAIPERGAACEAPPPDRFALRWPAGERPLVRIPLLYVGGELIVHAKIGGRDALAFLDSGASATALDARTPAAAEFRPSLELDGSGATQRVRVGFGELTAVDVGDLHAEHLPTVSVPIPGLDLFGDKKPDVILGYAFFARTVIRVDYKRSQVVFGTTTDGMFAKGTEPRAVALRVLKSKIVVEGSVDGAAASFVVDTGNGGGLDLYKRWATAHGFPGARNGVTLKGHFGVGAAETSSTFYRLTKGTLGPISFDGQLTNVSDPPGAGVLAGLAGNDVLARCDAVVFDVAHRKLWLEGTCERPVPERRAGWRFEKKPDPSVPDRPWVIGALWPGGAAERAGLQLGDRVLEVGGKPATNDVASLWALEEQPVGTKLPVVVTHEGAPKQRVRLVLELRAPPPTSPP